MVVILGSNDDGGECGGCSDSGGGGGDCVDCNGGDSAGAIPITNPPLP